MMGTKFWESAIWILFKEGFSKHLLSGVVRFPVHESMEAWFHNTFAEPTVVYREAYLHWRYDPMDNVMRVVVEYKKKVRINIPGEVVNNYLSSDFLDWFVTRLYYDNLIELTDEQKYWNELYFEKGVTYPHVYEKTVPYSLLSALEKRLDKFAPKPASFRQGYADSGKKLKAVVPGLSHKVMDGCPACKEYQGRTLEEVIIHLNDKHKWPRVMEDAKPGYKGPTIVDWVEEYALEMHLDMTFHQEEIKSEPPF